MLRDQQPHTAGYKNLHLRQNNQRQRGEVAERVRDEYRYKTPCFPAPIILVALLARNRTKCVEAGMPAIGLVQRRYRGIGIANQANK